MTNGVNINQSQIRSNFYSKDTGFEFSTRMVPNNREKEAEEQVSQAKQAELNDSGKIDYEEYFDYCKAHAVSNNPETSKAVVEKAQGCDAVRIMNFGKAINSYANTKIDYPTTQITNYA